DDVLAYHSVVDVADCWYDLVVCCCRGAGERALQRAVGLDTDAQRVHFGEDHERWHGNRRVHLHRDDGRRELRLCQHKRLWDSMQRRFTRIVVAEAGRYEVPARAIPGIHVERGGRLLVGRDGRTKEKLARDAALEGDEVDVTLQF